MKKKALAIELGQAVRQLRRAAGWTQAKLARKSRVPRTYISAIENGRANVTVSTAQMLFAAFGIDMEFHITSKKDEDSEGERAT